MCPEGLCSSHQSVGVQHPVDSRVLTLIYRQCHELGPASGPRCVSVRDVFDSPHPIMEIRLQRRFSFPVAGARDSARGLPGTEGSDQQGSCRGDDQTDRDDPGQQCGH